MAQLSETHESAGGHLNVSLRHVRTGRPAFALSGDGSSPGATLRAFLGGLQHHLPAFFLLLAPNLNSWKRFSGAAFVPRTNSWAVDNKTAAYRVVAATPAETRIEIRIPGADVNPYLALAAVLAAGRLGLEQQRVPTAPAIADAAAAGSHQGPPFPPDFRHAIKTWRAAANVRQAFAEDFIDAYARSREWQLAQFERVVTDWEIRQFAEGV